MKKSVRFSEDEGPTCLDVTYDDEPLGHLCKQKSGRWHLGYDWGLRLAAFDSLEEAKQEIKAKPKEFL